MLYQIIKTAAGVVASAGCTAVVKAGVDHITPENIKKSQEILFNIGALVIGGVVGKIGSEYVVELLDKITGQNKKPEVLEVATDDSVCCKKSEIDGPVITLETVEG